MNPLPFIIAAYVLVLVGVAGLTLVSWLAMRRAERAAKDVTRGK
jgi:hypothetical protein